MPHILTLANAKGGCGKSTVALNLAVCCARSGYRTLAVDLDQQGNLSAALGVDLNGLTLNTHRLLVDPQAQPDNFLVEVRPRLSLLPNTIDIDADDLLEAKKVNRELLLHRKLKPILPAFDLVIIDTPPAMRAATLNGLAVADTVVIPIDSSYFALLGLNQLLHIVAAVREAHKPNMVIRALTTLFNRRQNLDKEIRKRVEQFFGPELVLETVIHKNVGIAEAAAAHKAVVEYSTLASGTFDFTKLTQELTQEIGYEARSTANAVRTPESCPPAISTQTGGHHPGSGSV
ncbi:MAG: ParA family protein [Acidobacteriota bacterium]